MRQAKSCLGIESEKVKLRRGKPPNVADYTRRDSAEMKYKGHQAGLDHVDRDYQVCHNKT